MATNKATFWVCTNDGKIVAGGVDPDENLALWTVKSVEDQAAQVREKVNCDHNVQDSDPVLPKLKAALVERESDCINDIPQGPTLSDDFVREIRPFVKNAMPSHDSKIGKIFWRFENYLINHLKPAGVKPKEFDNYDPWNLTDFAVKEWKAGHKETALDKMNILNDDFGGAVLTHLIDAITELGDKELLPMLDAIANAHHNLTEYVITAINTISDPELLAKYRAKIETEEMLGERCRFVDGVMEEYRSGDKAAAMEKMNTMVQNSAGKWVDYLLGKIITEGNEDLIPVIAFIAETHADSWVGIKAKHMLTGAY